MRACKTILSLLLLLACIYALRAGSPLLLPGFKESVFTSTQLQSQPCKSVLFVRNADENASKRRETTGWALFGVGAGALVTGTVLLSKGLNDIINSSAVLNPENPALSAHPVSNHDMVLISAGGALAFTGLVLTPTGLIMGVTGKVRYNKYNEPAPFLITPVCDNYGLGMSGFF